MLLLYENSNKLLSCHVYGETEILLQTWGDIFPFMCDMSELQMSDGELFSLHIWTESPIIRSWNRLSVIDQNVVDFYWQNSTDSNTWWVLVKPVCFCAYFVIQGAEIMKVGFGKFPGEKSSPSDV